MHVEGILARFADRTTLRDSIQGTHNVLRAKESLASYFAHHRNVISGKHIVRDFSVFNLAYDKHGNTFDNQ